MNQQGRRNTTSMRKVFEIPKGPTGYGITLVGEKPCTVSGVCRDGNAYRAGVRNRDEIIRLFGKDVSEASHEDVAFMVGTSTGVLLVEVCRRKSESNCFATDNVRSSHHHPPPGPSSPRAKVHQWTAGGHALRESQNSQRNNKYASHHTRKIYHRPADDLKDSTLNCRLMHVGNVENVNLQLYSDHNTKYESRHARRTKHTIVSRVVRLSAQGRTSFQPRSSHSEMRGRNHLDSNESLSDGLKNKIDVCRVVGFVGSLKINTDPGDPSQRLKIVSDAVCQIQSSSRRFSPVLLVVNIDRMLVVNSHGSTVLVYPTYCVRFWSLCPKNKNQFVLVTQELRRFSDNDVLRETVETLCHVYVVDPMFSDHETHSRIAREFGIRCALGTDEDGCLEFPKSASEVIESVGNAYRQNLNVPLTATGACFPNLLTSLPSDYSEQDPPENVNCRNRVCIFDANSALMDEDDKESDASPIESSRLNAFVDPRIECCDQRPDHSFNSLASADSRFSQMSSSQSDQGSRSSSFVCNNLGKQTNVQQLPKLLGHHEVSNASIAIPEPKSSYNGGHSTNSTHICDRKLETTSKDYDELAVVKRNFESVSISSSSDSCTGSITSPSSASPPPPLPPRRKCLPHSSVDGRLLDNSGAKRLCANPPPMVPRLINKHLSTPGVPRPTGKAKSDVALESQIAASFLDRNGKKRQTACRSLSAVHGTKSPSDLMKTKVKLQLLDLQLSRKSLRSSSNDDSLVSVTSKDKRRFSEGISGLKSAVNLLKGGSFKDLKTIAKKSAEQSELSQRERINSDLAASSPAVSKVVEQSAEVVELGRASRWATSFDKLLVDNAGIATFMEFLKREYCQESLVFWLKCEDYHKLGDAQRKTRAAKIFAEHISPEADEQVNVTGVIEKDIEDNLETAASTLFDSAQKHVYQLMKQDKFGRFLKSDLYQQAVLAEIDGRPFPFAGEPEIKQKATVAKSVDKDDAIKKRRSLIFWNRKKFTKSSTNADMRATIDRKSSMSSAEKGEGQRLEKVTCRVVLVTGSVVPLQCTDGQTIAQALGKLGDAIKPRLVFYNVVDSVTGGSIDVTNDASTLVGRKICLRKCVVFRLGLGSKILAVRANPDECVKDVLGPVLLKHGFIFERTVIHIVGTGVILNGDTQADSLNCKSVLAQSMDNFKASDDQQANDWNTNNRRPLIGKPPLPRPKVDKVDGCPSAAFVLLNELFCDISGGRSNCFDLWVFDELGVSELHKANEVKTSSRGRAMESIMAFMRRSSSDKAKLKGNASFQKGSTPHLADDGRNGLPDVCTTGLKSHEKTFHTVPTSTEDKISAAKFSEKVNADILQNLVEGDNGANAAEKICFGLDGTCDNKDCRDDMEIETWRSETCSDSSEVASVFSDSCLGIVSEENDVRESLWLDADTTILSQLSSLDGNRTIGLTCDNSFTNSGILPCHGIAEEYFLSVCRDSASPDFEDSTLMIKSLSDIGL